ncbi:carboxypeptidase-like regulatory domain-containing protein [Carboxylicivirga sediminis]|uniref:Carboxypeptidase-like regulatory domain-containing protein n=1 Tax=Carboxylicivirga sediminis TaxID=2006564 RepID=A0A941F2P0_9BACT|nr:carboxypeptidase-like regulatory domain-containing protein [Carboxylicivirga sediminis]MBR8535653.1 carboxypeptidase-like regulatory domain-containing protein [Carboxylicivirga sediminis]
MNRHLISNFWLILFFICFLPETYAQITSINQQGITIEALFDSLTNQTAIDIAYDVNAIPSDSAVNVDFHNRHALQIVQEVLRNCQVDITYLNGQIIISKQLPAPQKPQHIVLTGTVLDQSDGNVLPLVNISVIDKPLGSITNSMGQFEFKLPHSYAGQQLAFSFLGYNTTFLAIPKEDSIIDIRLRPTSVRLDEIEVTYKDPQTIVEQLRTHHRNNYFDAQTVLEGFFRESIKQDESYVQVSEAIIEIIKPNYYNPSNLERVKFIKGRKKNDLHSMDFIDFKLEGGPFQFSRIDIARYQDFYLEDKQLYKYTYDGIAVLNDEIVYKIKFRPINDDGDLLYNGTLFIHSESFALVRSEFKLTNKALKTSGKTLIRKASRKIKVKPLAATYYIDYRYWENKWILNRIKGEIIIRINDKNQKVNSVFTATTELLISDCTINEKYKLRPSELYKSKYVLADQIKETDEEFWKDYNIIRPDEELEKVFKQTKVVSK